MLLTSFPFADQKFLRELQMQRYDNTWVWEGTRLFVFIQSTGEGGGRRRMMPASEASDAHNKLNMNKI